MQAQQQRFEQSLAVQQHDHDQFLAQLQSSTESSLLRLELPERGVEDIVLRVPVSASGRREVEEIPNRR